MRSSTSVFTFGNPTEMRYICVSTSTKNTVLEILRGMGFLDDQIGLRSGGWHLLTALANLTVYRTVSDVG